MPRALLAAAALLILGSACAWSATAKLDLTQPVTWLRVTPDTFGCALEQALGERDPRFNCALAGYQNQGDPCGATDAYYEGPEAPSLLAKGLGPTVDAVELAWEGGHLQSVTVQLSEPATAAEWRRWFHLPAPDALPDNLMAMSLQNCVDAGTGEACLSLMLIGFDHMGAGDVECPDTD